MASDIYKGVNSLARNKSKPPTNLNTDSNGNMLEGAEDVAKTWYQFLKSKFQPPQKVTDQKWRNSHAPKANTSFLRIISSKASRRCALTRQLDQIKSPSNSIKVAQWLCQRLLHELLQKYGRKRMYHVPIKFARAIFVMIYKNKGSSNDPTKYRCIGLLSHACLHGVQPVPAKATGRGDRVLRVRLPGSGRHVIAGIYNILTPRTISDEMLELGQKMYVTFIDYSAVFDSVSHKYF